MLIQCCVTNLLVCCGNKLTYLLTYSFLQGVHSDTHCRHNRSGIFLDRQFVCVEEDRKEDGMDTPGFASPIRAYRHNLCEMRKSHDASESEPTDLDSLGVLDLDLTVCPDVFGLKAFDDEMPVTRMLPGSVRKASMT